MRRLFVISLFPVAVFVALQFAHLVSLQDPPTVPSERGTITGLYQQPLYAINGQERPLQGFAFVEEPGTYCKPYTCQLTILLYDRPNGLARGDQHFIALFADGNTIEDASSYPGLCDPKVLKNCTPVRLHAKLSQEPAGGIWGHITSWGS